MGHDFIVTYKSFVDYTDLLYETYDTVIIELTDDTSMVDMNWSSFSDFGGPIYLESTAWYRNDSLLEKPIYSDTIISNYDPETAYSQLTTNIPGTYKRKVYNEYYVVEIIRKREDVSMEVTETGAEKIPEADQVEVYPNPANGFTTIQHGSISTGEVHVYGSGGRFIKAIVLDKSAESTEIDLAELSAGNYVLQVICDNELRLRSKLILE